MKEMKKRLVCFDCRWFEGEEDDAFGRCKRFAPHPPACGEENNLYADWPFVSPKETMCGDGSLKDK